MRMKKEKSQVIKTVQKVMPAVVSIVILKKLERLEEEIRRQYPEGFGSALSQIPPDKIDSHGRVQVGGGSGSLVDSRGIILTNKHVINEPFADYAVILHNNKKYPATILARDPMDDIAILQIKPESAVPVLELGNSEELELGQTVLAFGNALGVFKSTVSLGIISGLSRVIDAKPDPDSPSFEMRGLIQTDAAINPGNSGGPLTDIFGRVVGINTAVISGAQNIGFAIPIKAAERDLRDLKQYGRIRRPLLGVRYLTVTADVKEKLNLPVDYGALVTHGHPLEAAIAPHGPADKAGIKEKDIILTWNKGKITQEKNIQDYLEDALVGSTVTLTVMRGKEILEKKVFLTERR